MFVKNIICFLGGLLIISNTFAACVETTYTLKKGGNSAYDDYLYPSTAKYEKRSEGQQIKAYVCGQGFCSVNDVMRLQNASIGSGAANMDAVYKCVNIADSDRTGYGWQATVVDSYCTVGANKFKYNNTLKLYEYNGKYCSEINEVKELGTVLQINNDDIIAIASSENITIQQVFNQIKIKKLKIKNKNMSSSDFAKIKKLINKSEDEIRKDLKDMEVTIDGIQADIKDIKSDINALEREQFWDDIVNKIQNAKLNGLSRKMRNMKSQLKTKVNEEQVMDLINDAIKDMELTDEQVAQVKKMVEESARKTKMDINKINSKLSSMNWRITKNEAKIAWVRFYNNLRNNSQDRQINTLGDKLADMEKEMLTESDVENLIEQELKNAKLNKIQLEQVKSHISSATSGLKFKMNKLTKLVDELENNVQEIKTELTKQKVNAWFEKIKNKFINNVQDAKLKSLGNKFDKMKKDIKERPTEDEVMDIIQDAIDEAELNDNQLKQVKSIIDSEIESLGGDVKKLRNRVNSFEIKLAIFKGKMMWQDIRIKLQGLKINKINKNIDKLQSEVDEKTTEEQVMDLIDKALDGAELSDAQIKQVEQMITESAKKANARMDRINNRLKKLSRRVTKLEVKTWWNSMKIEFNKLGIKKLNNKMNSLESKLDEKLDEEQVMDLVEEALKEAELSDAQTKQVEQMISESAKKANARMDKIDNRLKNLSKRIRKVEWNVLKLKSKLALVDLENDVRYIQLRAKDKRLDKAIKKMNSKIKDINSKLDEKISQSEAYKLIQDAVDASVAELGTSLSIDIQIAFNQIVQDLNESIAEYVGEIENRLEKVEADVAELQQKNEDLLEQIIGLQSLTSTQRGQIGLLRAELKTKTTTEQVIKLILDNTQSLTDGQKQEVVAIIVEYTQSLSEGQKAEVQTMIELYVNPKIQQLDAKIDVEAKQRAAADKIQSAMSVLNSFASGADVSVWKNAEGKFNAARLASDATAGVVLGTAGGLISNSIIKKNQIKKGFEDIGCFVSGQIVAGYEDEFMVGMQ